MKKGFTLIEIVVSLVLISIIGVASVFGIKILSNNKKIDKLNKYTTNLINANSVYLENNKTALNNLYNNKEGVIIPLTLLQKEGLIDIDETDLTENDLKGEYIVTMLSEEKGECIDLKTVTSWNESTNQPIYICNNGKNYDDEINKMQKEIEELKATNLQTTNKIRKIYKGTSQPDNYVSYKGKTFNILSVEIDDSLILYSEDKEMYELFKEYKDSISYYERSQNDTFKMYSSNICLNSYIDKFEIIKGNSSIKISNDSNVLIDIQDFYDTLQPLKDYSIIETPYFYSSILKSDIYFNNFSTIKEFDYPYNCTGNMSNPGNMKMGYIIKFGNNSTGWNVFANKYSKINNIYKIHLKECMKISGGTGNIATPFVLSDELCN